MADKAHRFRKKQFLYLSFEVLQFLAVAGEREGNRIAIGAKPGNGIDQEVRSFDLPEFPDVDDVGGVGGFWDGVEFVGGDSVEHAANQSTGNADRSLISVAREVAFEQKQIGRIHQRSFEAAIERPLERVQRIMQRAAMRRVDANATRRARLQSDESPSLGAVPMQDIWLYPPHEPHKTHPCQNVSRVWLAVNGETINPEFEPWRYLVERCFSALAAGQAIGDDADLIAPLGLPIGQIQYVAENSAYRRSKRVENTNGLIRDSRHA